MTEQRVNPFLAKAMRTAKLMCWLGIHVYAGRPACFYCKHPRRKASPSEPLEKKDA